MFGFFKHRKKEAAPTGQDFRAEFQRRTTALYDKFAIEDTPYDELLDAMAAVENEMNNNGGVNWIDGDYDAYLEVIREHLTADSQFSAQQHEKIGWALGELTACSDDFKREGLSRRSVAAPIDYLIARVVDWCRKNEPESHT